MITGGPVPVHEVIPPGPRGPRPPKLTPAASEWLEPPAPPAHVFQTGTASFYGRRFHGRLTANGETFDMNELTAAHRSLPFDTRVRVHNLANGRSVVVRINDRGPFIKGRVIDLSRRAAEELGFIDQGLTEVEIIIEP